MHGSSLSKAVVLSVKYFTTLERGQDVWLLIMTILLGVSGACYVVDVIGD